MRWLVVCCLLSSVFAHAASVLLVPVDEKARALTEELVEPFAAENLTVKTAGPGSPAVNCLKDKKQKVACLTALAEKAKVIAVFVVSGGLRGPRGVLTLELIHQGKSLKTEATAVMKGKVKAQMRGPLDRLLQLVPEHEQSKPMEQPKATVTQSTKTPEPAPAATPPIDAPVEQPKLTAAPTPPPADPLALKTTPPKAAKPKVGAWVMTGLAVAAAGAAGAFGGLGLAAKSQLEAAPGGVSPLSYSEAQALQQQANLDFTIALGAGIGAGVSGVVAGILWGVE